MDPGLFAFVRGLTLPKGGPSVSKIAPATVGTAPCVTTSDNNDHKQ